MRLTDYRYASKSEKEQWLKGINFKLGVRYFGGKSEIGRAIFNRICNMAVRMKQDGNNPDIFLDVFTGGGKMALGIPAGWFNKIVMNDIDYGMYSFYKCCKECPEALVEMIKYVGSKMSKEMYQFIAFNRANTDYHNNRDEAVLLCSLYEEISKLEEKLENDTTYKNNKEKLKEAKIEYVKCWLNVNKNKTSGTHIDEDHLEDIIGRARKAYENFDIISDKGVDELTAAAFTFWVTKAEFLGKTDPYTVSYIFARNNGEDTDVSYLGLSEKEAIKKATDGGIRLVERINHQMERNNIIVENLDYRELIKKYNGKIWKDLDGQEHQPEENEKDYASMNKLWYMDPPYHPATLYSGMLASYEETFTRQDAIDLVKILHNECVDEYGELKYFLKSDYSPKYNRNRYEEVTEETIQELDKEKKSRRPDKNKISVLEKYITRYKDQVKCCERAYQDFDILEENDLASPCCKVDKDGKIIADKVEYYVDLLGDFSKGTSDSMSDDKKEGTEFLWCRGNYSVETAGVYRDGVLIEQKQEEQ